MGDQRKGNTTASIKLEDKITLRKLGFAVLRDNNYEGRGSICDGLNWMLSNKEIIEIVNRKIKDTHSKEG